MPLDLPPDRKPGDVIASDDIDKLSTAARVLRTQLLAPGPRLGVTGDSIIAAGDGAQDRIHGPSAQLYFSVLSRGRLVLTRSRGIAGQNSTQVRERFAADFPAGSVDLVIIRVGVNDVAQGIAPATTKANIVEMARLALAAGIVPMFDTQTPVDYHTAEQTAAQIALNRWLLAWCNREGILCADSWSAAVSPATATWPDASYTSDGLHPSAKGLLILARAWMAALGSLPPAPTRTATTTGDPTNGARTLNPLMLEHADGRASGWAFDGAAAATTLVQTITQAPGVPGNMQRMSFAGEPGDRTVTMTRSFNPAQGVDFEPGDTIELAVAVKVSSSPQPDENIRARLSLLFWNGGAYDVVDTLEGGEYEGVMTVRGTARPGDFVWQPLLSISSAGSKGTGYVQFGAVQITNLTRLGLR